MDRARKVLSKLQLPGGCLTREELVRAAWPQAVGKGIARHTLAVALVESRLVVEVEDLTWQGQLSTLRVQILAKLKEVLGQEIVRDIDFRLGMRRRPPQRAESAQTPKDEADRIEDPGMRMVYKSWRNRSRA